MADTPKDTLKHYVSGQVIDHKDLNAIITAVKREVHAEAGLDDGENAFLSSTSRAKPFEVEFVTDVDIPPYSVFGLKSGQAAAEPPVVNLQKAGINMMYFTNGPEGFYAGDEPGRGLANPIGFFEPVMLDSETELQIGDLCGPRPDSFKIEKDYVGFVCIGATNTEKRYWVIKAHDSGYLGRVTKRFNPFKPATKELGEGRVEIYTRSANIAGSGASGSCDLTSGGGGSGDTRNLKLCPSGKRIKAFSECEMGINVGEWVKLLPINGVGLVAQPHAMSPSSSSGACDFENLELWVCICNQNIPLLYDVTSDVHAAANIDTLDCCGQYANVEVGRNSGKFQVFSNQGNVVTTNFDVPNWEAFCNDYCLDVTVTCTRSTGVPVLTIPAKIGSTETICNCDLSSLSEGSLGSEFGSGSGDCVESVVVVTNVRRFGDSLYIRKSRIRYDQNKHCLVEADLGETEIELCCNDSSSSASSSDAASTSGPPLGSGL